LVAADLARLRSPPLVVVGAMESTLSRVALAAAASEAGGTFEVVDGADSAFVRNLPQVGKAVVTWVKVLS
jgi:hypothetical protein